MLTVMFSTHNGQRTLPTVLDAYTRLAPPPGGWKLVAIDNDSSDATDRVLRMFEKSLPMAHLRVAARGKNRALNVGLAERRGDLLVFTDDDAVPEVNWLVEMRNAADENPDFDIFGGAIRPRWERPPQPWHLDCVPQGITYAITNPAMATGPIAASWAWGPNMAIRNRVFDDGHRFDEAIGPQAGVSYPMGSETEFVNRLDRLGHRAWFVSTAIVGHIVRAFQMEKAWIMARAVRYGRGLCYRDELEDFPPHLMLFGVPRYRVRRMLEYAVRAVAAKILFRPQDAFREQWEFNREWGYLSELARARRKRLPEQPEQPA